ncbi:MAG TPA: ATP-binding protein [Pyrinomonadaceae bacterium]|nr:ATP-binding protein [Pyrinomonadaceae bacterium]
MLFESAPGLYLVLAPDLTIIAVSNAYLKATMTIREEILGRALFEVFPDNPDDNTASGVSNLRNSLDHVIRARERSAMAVQKYDIRRPEAEGGGFEERFWSPVNSPVMTSSGELAYIIHRVEDVTEFVRLKQLGSEHDKVTEELRHQAQRMEAEVYRRAQEVSEANRKLSTANAELERLYHKTKELDQLKSEFFANVSHELRTPLSLILGPTGKLIESAEVSEEARSQLRVVVRNANLLLHHVNDLLDASKLESGRMSLKYAEVDLGQLLRFFASYFQSLADQQTIDFSITGDQELLVEVDAEKLQRVILNLLSNAFKFTPTGGTIRCSLRCDNGSAVIEIADSGPGIPTDARELIFERFRQLEGGATRRHGGTGLGLSIARDFVELHNGTISVAEAPEGGAQFTVTLPLKAPVGTTFSFDPVSNVAASVYHQVSTNEISSTGGENENGRDEESLVLVVEDNSDLNKFIRDSLAGTYRTDFALDGAEGLRKVIDLRPDLVVSDVMMPNLDGLSLLREIRLDPRICATPVILLSARAGEEATLAGLETGADDYLVKPFSARELLARVRTHLEMANLRRSLEFELEQRVLDRTAELATKNEELQVTTQQLWQTSKLATMGELAASIAHELNNPLATISLRTEQLITQVSDPGRASIEIILNEIERMAELVKNMLEFSRRNQAQISTVDIRSEIFKSIEFIGYYLRKCSVEVITRFSESVPMIHADRQQLRQIFLNLLTNATDAMPGGGKITIEVTEAELNNSPGIMIMFTDTGDGIPEDKLSKIWEPFFTTKPEGKGTGLGMGICRRIVEEHNGRITVKSELGQGTTVRIMLPATTSDD